MQCARYRKTLLASCLFSLLVVNGCGDRPVQPLGSDKAATEAASGSLGKRGSRKSNNSTSTSATDKRVKRKTLLATTQNKTASNLITASSGGAVSINELSISIPAGAVSGDKNISIDCNDNLYIQADFGPDGTQFNVPATITVSYANADITGSTPANLSISWFDPAQGQWVDLGGTVDNKNKTISVQVWHFTLYSLSLR